MDPGDGSWCAVKDLALSTCLIFHVTLVHDSQNNPRPQDKPNGVSSRSDGAGGQSEVRLSSG